MTRPFAVGSSRENADVAARWANLYSVEVPQAREFSLPFYFTSLGLLCGVPLTPDASNAQDLMRMIAQQREACGAIIASKDNLIADLKNDLTSKDAEYVKVLRIVRPCRCSLLSSRMSIHALVAQGY